jgi:peptidyl-prolyl cis-trans isomerase C
MASGFFSLARKIAPLIVAFQEKFMKRALPVALMIVLAVACRKSTSPAAAAVPLAAAESASPATAAQAAPAQPAGAPGSPVQPPTPAKPVPAQLPAVVATVDGEKIERWELEGAIKAVEARAGSPIPADKRDEVLRGLIDQLVAYHVLAREAHDRKLDATEAEVTARLTQIKGGFPNEQAFQEALKAQSMTLERLQQQTRMGMQINKIIEAEVASKISVQDAEVDAFYNQNRPQFEQGESVHASHILVTAPQAADPATKQEAKSKAEQVLKDLKGGADFAKLAKEQSQDPGSAKNGGDLGFFPKGQTDPAFETAAFQLKAGDVSDVVETQFGFHVIKLHEHRDARTAPLTEVSGQIKEFLAGQQRDAKISEFVDQAKTRRKVEILI